MPMNFLSIRIVAKPVILWCVLVTVVVLLTLLFTILGTITCAVVTGMMMASIRHRRWQTVPVSMVFPVVVAALVHFAKVELVGQQKILLPLLCFGAFWLMYLLTCGLIKLERSAENIPPESAFPGRAKKSEHGLAVADNTPLPPGELRLESLQGRWSCESGGLNGDAEKRIIEVVGNNLSLSIVGRDGRAQLVAKGSMKLEDPKLSATGSENRKV